MAGILAQQVTADSAPGANTKPAVYRLALVHHVLSIRAVRVANIESLAQII